jgi:polysaccharide deacetylase 2 family uncharacterized protein YibQ
MVKMEERFTEKAKVVEKASRVPEVAIILDDAGGRGPDYKEIFSIKEPLTISVLPNLQESEAVALSALTSGKEVMLHLPMETYKDSYDRHDGSMITTNMSNDDIEKLVNSNIAAVFGASGVNNHMGSKATEDKRVMDEVLKVIKEKNLYFVDSRTSKKSVAFDEARKMKVKSAENNVFLDVEAKEEKIKNKLGELILKARKFGYAVGIAHVTRPVTIATLKELMPYYEKNGIKFVFASEVVR